jgi:hypothetical protein
MKTLNSKSMIMNLVGGILLLVLLAGCTATQSAERAEAPSDQLQATRTTAAATLTPKPTRTPLPSRTPSPTPERSCKSSGAPETFEPSGIPDILLKTDAAIFEQASQHTETNFFRFQSYGAASYGSETRLHYTCHDTLPSQTVASPDLLSYCSFERETSSIHVLSGEVRGTPERIVNESLVRGREGWVKQEGGSWYLSWELNDSDLENALDAFKIAPFFSAEESDCQAGQDHPGAVPFCFSVNIPGFLRSVSGEEITFADCVTENQGVLWIDPKTGLPKEWKVSFRAAVRYSDQESDEFPYNLRIEMSQEYLAFNEEFDYPDPRQLP